MVIDINECVGIIINNRKLMINKQGTIWSITPTGSLKIIKNVNNNGKGYNQIGCGNFKYLRQRIICYTYLGLNIHDKELFADHINGDRLDNSVVNLRLVTRQQNCWNQIKATGICKKKNKYTSQICLNKKKIYLGFFNTAGEAHTAYLKAKLIYHKII